MKKRWIGRSILSIGVIHSLFGFVFTRAILAQLVGEGLWNTVNGQPDREATFWFLLSGFLMILIGLLVDWIEVHAEHFPGFLGWILLALTILCVFIMPISGGWLLFLPAVGSIVRSRPQNISAVEGSN